MKASLIVVVPKSILLHSQKSANIFGLSNIQRVSLSSSAKDKSATSSSASIKDPLVLQSFHNGVSTLTMNNPTRLNAWTKPMLLQLIQGLETAAKDPQIKITIITGKGTYYCAGVDLSGTIKANWPQKIWNTIKTENQALFDTFLDHPKPILVAVNGPAIGASVTSATLCDGIVASDTATFSTPFARLGIPPEGCSSVHFQRIMGAEGAQKMLHENWVPTATEAKKLGFVLDVVPIEQLQSTAQKIAENWIIEKKVRKVADDLKNVNKQESEALATAFLSTPFLMAQYKFLASKGKTQLAYVFRILAATRPLWSLMLDSKSK